MTHKSGPITALPFSRVVPRDVTAEIPCAWPALHFVVAPLHPYDHRHRLTTSSLTVRASVPELLDALNPDSPKVELPAASYRRRATGPKLNAHSSAVQFNEFYPQCPQNRSKHHRWSGALQIKSFRLLSAKGRSMKNSPEPLLLRWS
jgi:hypothetical protein